MEFKEQAYTVLKDPLTSLSRKTRRNLLIASLITILIVWMGLIPKKITFLGIEFTNTNQSSILYVLGFVVIYFCIAFYIYGKSDLRAWKRLVDEQDLPKIVCIELDHLYEITKDNLSPEEIFEFEQRKSQMEKLLPVFKKDRRFGFDRSKYFEIWVPMVIGVMAIISVIIKLILMH